MWVLSPGKNVTVRWTAKASLSQSLKEAREWTTQLPGGDPCWAESSAKALGSGSGLHEGSPESLCFWRVSKGRAGEAETWEVPGAGFWKASQIGQPWHPSEQDTSEGERGAVNKHTEITGIDGECSGHIDWNHPPLCKSLPRLGFLFKVRYKAIWPYCIERGLALIYIITAPKRKTGMYFLQNSVSQLSINYLTTIYNKCAKTYIGFLANLI